MNGIYREKETATLEDNILIDSSSAITLSRLGLISWYPLIGWSLIVWDPVVYNQTITYSEVRLQLAAYTNWSVCYSVFVRGCVYCDGVLLTSFCVCKNNTCYYTKEIMWHYLNHGLNLFCTWQGTETFFLFCLLSVLESCVSQMSSCEIQGIYLPSFSLWPIAMSHSIAYVANSFAFCV